MLRQTDLVAGLPAFHALNGRKWINYLSLCRMADLHDQDITTYAWRLGCLLQAEISAGVPLEVAIIACAADADVSQRITCSPDNFAKAIDILAEHWAFGDRLKEWYLGNYAS